MCGLKRVKQQIPGKLQNLLLELTDFKIIENGQ